MILALKLMQKIQQQISERQLLPKDLVSMSQQIPASSIFKTDLPPQKIRSSQTSLPYTETNRRAHGLQAFNKENQHYHMRCVSDLHEQTECSDVKKKNEMKSLPTFNIHSKDEQGKNTTISCLILYDLNRNQESIIQAIKQKSAALENATVVNDDDKHEIQALFEVFQSHATANRKLLKKLVKTLDKTRREESQVTSTSNAPTLTSALNHKENSRTHLDESQNISECKAQSKLVPFLRQPPLTSIETIKSRSPLPFRSPIPESCSILEPNSLSIHSLDTTSSGIGQHASINTQTVARATSQKKEFSHAEKVSVRAEKIHIPKDVAASRKLQDLPNILNTTENKERLKELNAKTMERSICINSKNDIENEHLTVIPESTENELRPTLFESLAENEISLPPPSPPCIEVKPSPQPLLMSCRNISAQSNHIPVYNDYEVSLSNIYAKTSSSQNSSQHPVSIHSMYQDSSPQKVPSKDITSETLPPPQTKILSRLRTPNAQKGSYTSHRQTPLLSGHQQLQVGQIRLCEIPISHPSQQKTTVVPSQIRPHFFSPVQHYSRGILTRKIDNTKSSSNQPISHPSTTLHLGDPCLTPIGETKMYAFQNNVNSSIQLQSKNNHEKNSWKNERRQHPLPQTPEIDETPRDNEDRNPSCCC